MVIMHLKIHNFLLFTHFKMNMSYPKKIVNSGIESEYLEGKPNFRYKKFIILMGANATGKTALGKILMRLFNFIDRKEFSPIADMIEDPSQTAELEMDFVPENDELYRLSLSILPKSEDTYKSSDVIVHVQHVQIKRKDNYERCAERFQTFPVTNLENYIQELEKIPQLSWMFEFPVDTDIKKRRMIFSEELADTYTKDLERVFKSLDPRIQSVEKLQEAEDTFLIRMGNNTLLIEKGKINNPQKLSSGTLEGIGIANLLAAIKTHACGFYYCDEKFSHVHSEVEKAFLSVFISSLGANEQLITTTHNLDVLDLNNMPYHAFAFMRRDPFDNNSVSCIFASERISKNNVSLKLAAENDAFSSFPNIDSILELIDEEAIK